MSPSRRSIPGAGLFSVPATIPGRSDKFGGRHARPVAASFMVNTAACCRHPPQKPRQDPPGEASYLRQLPRLDQATSDIHEVCH